VAIDELMREQQDSNLYYWPSYEIVIGYLKHPMIADQMHPSEQAIRAIVEAFSEAYCIR
jgi:hypothetical protein